MIRVQPAPTAKRGVPIAVRLGENITIAVVLVAIASMSFPVEALAQQKGGRSEVFAGSEIENYLRYAQTMGAAPLYPWSIRAFSPSEIDRLMDLSGGHPWEKRYSFGGRGDRLAVDYVRPAIKLRYNSAFPFGSNDGPVWAGRGITTSVQLGISLRFGPVSLSLAPEFFTAQNKEFPLFPNGDTSRLRFADGQFSAVIDRPQRFGDKAYAVFDPGQSTLRIDFAGIGAGVSTANQIWGPSENYAFILGNNSAGFPHAFFGTSRPANLFLFRLHGRLQWGILSQSDYSPVTGPRAITSLEQPGTLRFMSGIIATIQPRGMTGLEIGGARFFHTGWPEGGPGFAHFRKPLEAIFKYNLRPDPPLPGSGEILSVRDNQLASLFARWALPGAGFEIYGEYGREDHSAHTRDLLLEPDHTASRMLGFRKMWRSGYGLRAEAINFEGSVIRKLRGGGTIYVHSILRQGHTHRGQLLGADVGVGSGAGSTIAVDRYSDVGKMSLHWSRKIGHQVGQYYVTGVDGSQRTDVLHSLGFDVLRFVRRVDVSAKAVLTGNFARNFRAGVFNTNLVVGTRYSF